MSNSFDHPTRLNQFPPLPGCRPILATRVSYAGAPEEP
jgi:hypothetical protein